MRARSFAGYVYQDRLTEGMFGEIHRAHDSQGREVSILHVAHELVAVPGFLKSLADGAKKLSLLDHPNVIATRKLGKSKDGKTIVVCDAVRGPVPLSKVISSSVPLPVVTAIVRQLAHALGAAHSLSICHGMLRPHSVWIDFDGALKLGNFAVCGALAGAKPDFVGSAIERRYLAPELSQGQAPTPATDIFAFGVLVARLLKDVRHDQALVLKKLAERAAAPAVENRYLNGTEVEDLLDELVLRKGLEEAERKVVSTFVNTSLAAAGASDLGKSEIDVSRPSLPKKSMVSKLSAVPKSNMEFSDSGSLSSQMDDLISGLEEEDNSLEQQESSGERSTVALRKPVPPPNPSPLGKAGPAPAIKREAVLRQNSVPEGMADFLKSREESTGAGDLTRVDDDAHGQADVDPVSEIIRMGRQEEPEDSKGTRETSNDDDFTPIPAPAPARPGSVTSILDVLEQGGKAEPAAPQDDLDSGDSAGAVLDVVEGEKTLKASNTGELDALLGELEDEPSAPAATAVSEHSVPAQIEAGTSAAFVGAAKTEGRNHTEAELDAVIGALVPEPRPVDSAPPSISPQSAQKHYDPLEALAQEPEKKKFNTPLWLGVIVFVLSSMVMFVYFQTDVFHPERARAKEEQYQAEIARKEKALRDALPVPGDISLSVNEDGAAVWLFLGETPLESVPLNSQMVHEIRIEKKGYRPRDMQVSAPHWQKGDKINFAKVEAKLEQSPRPSKLPAIPAEPSAAVSPGPIGKGAIHLDSDPPGAKAWLFVGVSPDVKVMGLVAGRDYHFLVRKDGFEQAEIEFAKKDWYISGDSGPMKPYLSGKVEIKPEPKLKKKSRRR